MNGHIKEFKLGIDIGSVRGDVENLEMKFSMRSRSELQDTAGSKADIRLPVKVHGSVNSFNPRATPSYGWGWSNCFVSTKTKFSFSIVNIFVCKRME